MKDLFSENSFVYQQARPSYPHEVVAEILKHVPSRQFAWDCGAGSGQFTQLLAPYFEQVVATDLSTAQLQQAPYFENVSYQLQYAEKTTFSDHSFDLITVAQAIHWFNFDAFYAEVKRTLKENGVLAVIGYGLIEIKEQKLNDLLHSLYFKTLNGYWDNERKYIDQAYKTIPFPLDELDVPELKMNYQWNGDQLLNYLSTWSALKNYAKQNNNDPLQPLKDYLNDKKNLDMVYQVEFPIFLRIGRMQTDTNQRKCKKVPFMKYAFKS